MGLVQGITQGVQASHAAKDQKRANNELTRRMEVSRQAYQQRRPQVAQERQAALQKQLGVYNPVTAMMGEMTGGKYAPDLTAMGQSPINPKATTADITVNDPQNRGVRGMSYGDIAGIRNDLAAQGFDTSGIERDLKVNAGGIANATGKNPRKPRTGKK